MGNTRGKPNQRYPILYSWDEMALNWTSNCMGNDENSIKITRRKRSREIKGKDKWEEIEDGIGRLWVRLIQDRNCHYY